MRMGAARRLTPGALLALLDAEPVAVAELVTPWGRAGVDCVAAIGPDALAQALTGTMRVAAADWTAAERACVAAHPADRDGYAAEVIELVVFAAREALAVYVVTPAGRAGTTVASPDRADVEERAWEVAERYFSLRPPERVTYQQWSAIETGHLVVRYAPDATAPVRRLARRYETALASICGELGIREPAGPITVWSYDDRAHQGALWSSTSNMALPEAREVHMKGGRDAGARARARARARRVGRARQPPARRGPRDSPQRLLGRRRARAQGRARAARRAGGRLPPRRRGARLPARGRVRGVDPRAQTLTASARSGPRRTCAAP